MLKKDKSNQVTSTVLHTCHSRPLNFYQNEQIHDHLWELLVAIEPEPEFDCSTVGTNSHMPADSYDVTVQNIVDAVGNKRTHRMYILRNKSQFSGGKSIELNAFQHTLLLVIIRRVSSIFTVASFTSRAGTTLVLVIFITF